MVDAEAIPSTDSGSSTDDAINLPHVSFTGLESGNKQKHIMETICGDTVEMYSKKSYSDVMEQAH